MAKGAFRSLSVASIAKNCNCSRNQPCFAVNWATPWVCKYPPISILIDNPTYEEVVEISPRFIDNIFVISASWSVSLELFI